MLQKLKERVVEANRELERRGLVIYTWGNVSGILRDEGLVVIKPSGVPYEDLAPDNMVVLDLEGNVVEGSLRPSSDTPTHLELYRRFPEAGGIVHTHSSWATIWAQAGKPIPCLGTTHADYSYGEIPCTRPLTKAEVEEDYELNTGRVIGEVFQEKNYKHVPGVLVAEHGPFTWGKDPEEAVYNSVVMEQLAMMAYHTVALVGEVKPISTHVADKHYMRKHGPNAYYGQK
jgi:L-ribulose-5-phosphate 4-epimerase